jgi:hypothetical protein
MCRMAKGYPVNPVHPVTFGRAGKFDRINKMDRMAKWNNREQTTKTSSREEQKGRLFDRINGMCRMAKGYPVNPVHPV